MAIEYLNPEDRYDIEVFNRNFRQVESALNNMPPLDWLDLPDISQETSQKACMLLHIGPNACNKMVMSIMADAVPNVIVDWGDGSTDTEHAVVSNKYYYYVHEYNFETLDAPLTVDGYKQVIVTVKDNPDEEAVNWTSFNAINTLSVNGVRYYGNYSLLRDITIQAGAKNQNLQLYCNTTGLLRSIKAHNVKFISAGTAASLSELFATGTNLTTVSTTQTQLEHISIPDNAYTNLGLGTNSRTKELVLHLSNAACKPSFITSRCLERLELHGLRWGFTLSYAPMKREAIISLFESLGQADMTLSESNRTIDLTTFPAYPQLTDTDKKIARDKGFVVT